jgi:hypothetical protein
MNFTIRSSAPGVGLALRLLAAMLLPLSIMGIASTAQADDSGPNPERNISGIWDGYPNFIEAAHADPKIAPPKAGDPPLKPRYLKAYLARRKAETESDLSGKPIAAVGTDCLPYGMPRMMKAIYPMEILQTPGQITIIEEAFTQVRHIYVDRPQMKMDEVAPGYYGRSTGHWEGDTLTVDTIGVKPSVLGYEEMPHSDRMRITERIRMAFPNVLNDTITVEDPVYLEKPWTWTFAYKRRRADYELMEYICDSNLEYVDEKGLQHFRTVK